jgi:hypothetical protein
MCVCMWEGGLGVWSGHGRVSTGARCPKSGRKEVPVGLVTPARRVAGVVGRNMGFLRSVVRSGWDSAAVGLPLGVKWTPLNTAAPSRAGGYAAIS